MFTLQETPLDPDALRAELANPHAGAFVCFEGWVRNHHQGESVVRLEYEAFPAMAIRVGTAILEEARTRFSLCEAKACHRVGSVAVGERAVWVGVTAAHRQEAFAACRWIMDRIKADLPMWKREHYTDGRDPVWVGAGACCHVDDAHDPATHPRYARQVALKEVGVEGQRRLADARVLVVGAGGLGCPALQYLAAAGVGTITIVDGDRVEVSNLHRQVLFGASTLGQNKAEAAASRLRDLNDQIAVRALPDAATPETLPEWIAGHDVVLDCTDNFETRYAVHDACWNARIPLVQAAVYQSDGWVHVIDPKVDAGCFRCVWPEPPPIGCVGNCAEAGVLGVTPGLLGVMQATEAIKCLLGRADALTDATLYVDVLSGRTQRVQRNARPDCLCQQAPRFATAATAPGPYLYPGQSAEALMREALVVDLREPHEREGDPEWIQRIPNVPRAEWSSLADRSPGRPLILCCASGNRSRVCLEQLGNPTGVYAWTRGILELPESARTR